MQVRLVVTGRGYDAARQIPEHLALPEGCSIDEALQAVARLYPQGKGLAGSCLVAVSGAHLGTVRSHKPHVLNEGDELVVVAPVAGG
jgi:molybdopterin converting factor small subunit